MKNHVWVAYTRKKPHLPYAIAETAEEVSQLTGKTKNNIYSCWSKYQKGVLKSSPFHHVFVGGE